MRVIRIGSKALNPASFWRTSYTAKKAGFRKFEPIVLQKKRIFSRLIGQEIVPCTEEKPEAFKQLYSHSLLQKQEWLRHVLGIPMTKSGIFRQSSWTRNSNDLLKSQPCVANCAYSDWLFLFCNRRMLLPNLVNSISVNSIVDNPNRLRGPVNAAWIPLHLYSVHD